MKIQIKDLKAVSNANWFVAFFTLISRYLFGLLFQAIVFGSLRFSGLDFLFCVIFGLFVYLYSSLVGPKVRKWSFILGMLVMTLLFVSQILYYQLFKTLYTIYSMLNGAQVVEFYSDIINLIFQNWWIIMLYFIPFILVVYLTSNAPRISYRLKLQQLIVVPLMIVLWIGGLYYINNQEEGAPSIDDLYHQESQPLLASNQFGLLTAMRIDFRNYFFPANASIETEPIEIPETSDPQTSPNQETEPGETPGEPVVVQKPWVLDIDFEQLAKLTTDETKLKMDEYFQQVKPTYTNDYTGIAKGFNLIFITAESYSRFSVDPELTPTLYMMQHEGLNFTNFYNPVWGVSTSDGEYVGVTGLIPKNGVWSLAYAGEHKRDLAFTYGNLLRRYEYKTMAFHNHTYNYYKRDISHPNMGYDYYGIGNGLDIRKTWPESDVDLMTETMDRYMDYDKFHAYYMTVSGHMRYTYSGNYIASKNKALVEDLPYKTEEAKAYLATQIELDRAMETLLNKLREKGLADKTLIVLNADHYPYGLPKETIDELAGETVEENFEIYRGSLLVYFDGIEPATIDKYVSSLDVLPTVYNLMDIPFDSRLLAGRDILSNEPSLVIFVNRSWITDYGRYNALTKTFTPNEGVKVSESYVRTVNRLVSQRFEYSRLILEKDYYAHINQVAVWPELD